MKNRILKSISLLLVASIMLSSCASTTLIQSTPDEAKVYLNDELVGKTPYSMRDKKIVGTRTDVRIEKEGYETFYTTIRRNEEVSAGAIVGGILFVLPYLWIMKYKPTHTYELKPTNGDEELSKLNSSTAPKTKAEKLLELKEQFEKGTITKEEYEKEKKRVYRQF